MFDTPLNLVYLATLSNSSSSCLDELIKMLPIRLYTQRQDILK